MKKFLAHILFLSLLVSVFVQCSCKQKIDENVIVISQKLENKSGFELRLKNIVSDSRCPEGVTCIWAGEVSVVIELYNDKKLVEEKALVFNSKNAEANKEWFQKYYSNNIKSVSVLPDPKEGVVVKPEKNYLSVVFN